MTRSMPVWMLVVLSVLVTAIAGLWSLRSPRSSGPAAQPAATAHHHDHPTQVVGDDHGEQGQFRPARVVVGSASFDYRPGSALEMARRAPLIVSARVTGVTAGVPQKVVDAAEPGGGYQIPTQTVQLQPLTTLKGKAPSSLQLYRVGNDTMYVHGEPPFVVGEQYILFLRPQENGGGKYLVLAPEGRLRVRLDGSLESRAPAVEGAAPVEPGRNLAEVRTLVARSAQ